jgi:type II secretory pathway pseudopilin PulG
VLVCIGIISLSVAVLVPRLTASKRQAVATALGGDLRTFATALETYAQERGSFPEEVAAGVLPPEMSERLGATGWLKLTPIGGQYNWDSNQMHYGTRYKAVIQVSSTEASPLPEDVELWEAIDRILDDGDLTKGIFRLGSNNEPIYIVSP